MISAHLGKSACEDAARAPPGLPPTGSKPMSRQRPRCRGCWVTSRNAAENSLTTRCRRLRPAHKRADPGRHARSRRSPARRKAAYRRSTWLRCSPVAPSTLTLPDLRWVRAVPEFAHARSSEPPKRSRCAAPSPLYGHVHQTCTPARFASISVSRCGVEPVPQVPYGQAAEACVFAYAISPRTSLNERARRRASAPGRSRSRAGKAARSRGTGRKECSSAAPTLLMCVSDRVKRNVRAVGAAPGHGVRRERAARARLRLDDHRLLPALAQLLGVRARERRRSDPPAVPNGTMPRPAGAENAWRVTPQGKRAEQTSCQRGRCFHEAPDAARLRAARRRILRRSARRSDHRPSPPRSTCCSSEPAQHDDAAIAGAQVLVGVQRDRRPGRSAPPSRPGSARCSSSVSSRQSLPFMRERWRPSAPRSVTRPSGVDAEARVVDRHAPSRWIPTWP